MKKLLLIALFSITYTISFAQLITNNPSVKRKSANDVFINKIEITDDFTIVYMKFVAQSDDEKIDEFFKQNPEYKRRFDNLDSYEQSLVLKEMRQRNALSIQTISIQPTSVLKAKDGRTVKFIKASGIPVAPQRQKVEDAQRYYFRVFFEKLPAGIQEVDLIENLKEKDGEFNYWNLYGIEVNNPPIKKEQTTAPLAAIEKKKEEKVAAPTQKFITVKGKVLDSETNLPLSASIICRNETTNAAVDSVHTSRSGSFEFDLIPNQYVYQLSAEGYQSTEETYDLQKIATGTEFSQNFYLTPIKEASEPAPLIEDKVADDEPIIEKVAENTFRLDKVYFATGESTLLPESSAQLNGLVKMMTENPNLKIRIEGHTDDRGEPQLNKKLSLERAFNVREYLISKGIAGNRIQFTGYGETRPLAVNDSEENRQKNRRVEFVIIEE